MSADTVNLVCPSPLAISVLAEFARARMYWIDPEQMSSLAWKVIDQQGSTPSLSQLANEALVLTPTELEECIWQTAEELGLAPFQDTDQASLVWKACYVFPSIDNQQALEEALISVIPERLQKDRFIALRVSLADLHERLRLGPDDPALTQANREWFVQEHCRLWLRTNADVVRPHFDAIRKVLG